MTIRAKLREWREASAASGFNRERDKGTAFERLCRVYLSHDPQHVCDIGRVQFWSEWAPINGYSALDRGVDLVAEDTRHGGKWVAIQCKCYEPGRKISSLDTFVSRSATNDFTRRIVIDTSGKPWTRPVTEMVSKLSVPISRVDQSDLENSAVDWDQWLSPQPRIVRKPKKTPRPHQEKAIVKVVKGLQELDSRGKMLMACGTGKTYTALCIAEQLAGHGRRVLYLVPSLALMSQTVRDWTHDAEVPIRPFAVCSDSQVGKRRTADDNLDMDTLDLVIPATTSAPKLALAASDTDQDWMTVVFATYHSLPVISEAQREHGLLDFDLIVCDEAHRTAGGSVKGDKMSAFVRVHSQDNVRGHRRLYMTATPKVYAATAKKKARTVKGGVLYSMDDPGHYGPVLYELPFGEAVERDLLSDYKVIILSVPETTAVAGAGKSLGQGGVDLENVGKLIGCWRALSKADADEFPEDDRQPMRTAIAYCANIKTSKQLRDQFTNIVEEYKESDVARKDGNIPEYRVDSHHVDGTFKALARTEELGWLRDADTTQGQCRVLTNARCLSEGVDIPSLDAILFMQPRKSQVDVIQAVGRVMRKAADKKMGYVILPVVVPSGANPEEALDDSKTFRAVWQMLNAIRSHDERFDAMINQLENGEVGDRISIITLQDWDQSKPSTNGDPPPLPPPGEQAKVPFPAAIRAKIVEKCGNRKYWEDWATDVADIARRHIVRIKELVGRHEAAQETFEYFLDELRDDLNEGITPDQAIEMLAQHLVTRPVFQALYKDARFVDHNPVSKGIDVVLEVLDTENIDRESETLEAFYASVVRRAESATTHETRQKLIVELYDKFFRNAFPKMASQLGIVYTPVQLVDFVLHSVNDVLEDEFGKSLASKGVHVVDPFTGTGTFITRMIRSGLIPVTQLPQKYRHELHANELVLLAYYIAAVSIEGAYHDAVDGDEYERFPGIVLTDTFELQDRKDLFADVMVENSERRKRQKSAPIQVVVGNPPWSAGQRSENDAAANRGYPVVDGRMAETYVAHSKATSKKNLYDSYIRAIRWASDRIGGSGVIGFVTNAGWVDGKAMDGLRKCLTDEFTGIHVLHLRGNQRTQGERSRREGGKVFGSGSRAPVAVTLFVKNPARKGQGCQIRLHDIGDYLSAGEKLDRVVKFGSVRGINEWQEIKPDKHNDWLNKRDPGFVNHMAIGDKRKTESDVVFDTYSQGVLSSRDAWCYNGSASTLWACVRRMAAFYNSERERLKAQIANRESKAGISHLVSNDPAKISWSSSLFQYFLRDIQMPDMPGTVVAAQYRPFSRQHLCFGRMINHRVGVMASAYPHLKATNRLLCVSGLSETGMFSCLMVREIADCSLLGAGQCFPLYLYAKAETADVDMFGPDPSADEHGYVRRSSINANALRDFAAVAGDRITAEDLFYYVYGLLHIPAYQAKYQNNLKKELPRIPLPDDRYQFQVIAAAGRQLGDLHANYDAQKPWALQFEQGGWRPGDESWNRVGKMKHPGRPRQKDRTRIIYNEHITVGGIPERAYDYVVNGKPAIGWVMERQCVKTDKKSGIVNDANRYAIETMGDPAYPLKLLARVIRISMDTLNIVERLPAPSWAE